MHTQQHDDEEAQDLEEVGAEQYVAEVVEATEWAGGGGERQAK